MALLPLYYFYDPQGGGFPACPFYQLTGLFCTGCGSQRALHDLLHLDLGSSLGHNLLLAPALVLIVWHLAAVTWDGKKKRKPPEGAVCPSLYPGRCGGIYRASELALGTL